MLRSHVLLATVHTHAISPRLYLLTYLLTYLLETAWLSQAELTMDEWVTCYESTNTNGDGSHWL